MVNYGKFSVNATSGVDFDVRGQQEMTCIIIDYFSRSQWFEIKTKVLIINLILTKTNHFSSQDVKGGVCIFSNTLQTTKSGQYQNKPIANQQ